MQIIKNDLNRTPSPMLTTQYPLRKTRRYQVRRHSRQSVPTTTTDRNLGTDGTEIEQALHELQSGNAKCRGYKQL